MKPDWQDAPEWAQWLAMDKDGWWFWYETRPLASADVWLTDTRVERVGGHIEWSETREERPSDPR